MTEPSVFYPNPVWSSSRNDRIGIIEKRWRPADEILGVGEKIKSEVGFSNLSHGKTMEQIDKPKKWEQFTDKTPSIRLTGHTEATFPYVPMGINYIIQELLKNSFR